MEPQETKVTVDAQEPPKTPIERMFPDKTKGPPPRPELDRVVLVVGQVQERRAVAQALAGTAAPFGEWGMDFLDHELEERTHAAHRLMDMSRRMPMPAGTFEQVADVAHPAFSGHTPRHAYAAMKSFLREQCGTDCFGRWLVQRLDLWLPQLGGKVRAIVVADVDRFTDALPIVERYGRDRTTILSVGDRPAPFKIEGAREARVLAVESADKQVEQLRRALPDFYPPKTETPTPTQEPETTQEQA